MNYDATIRELEEKRDFYAAAAFALRKIAANEQRVPSIDATPRKRGRQRGMSEAGRAAIAEGQRKRWERVRQQQNASTEAAPVVIEMREPELVGA